MTLSTETIKTMALEAINDLKALDVQVLDVRKKASFTDFMIFASGSSNRHVKSIANSVMQKAKDADFLPNGVEGVEQGEWVLVDLGDVIVHVMLPKTRVYYELEKLWSSDSDSE